MELFIPSQSDLRAYRSIMLQHGSGFENDGYYVYNQDGEGFGQFFGSLLKNIVPLFSRGIKATYDIAKPHLQKAAREVVSNGSKRLLNKISGDIVNSIERPKKRRRRRI